VLSCTIQALGVMGSNPSHNIGVYVFLFCVFLHYGPRSSDVWTPNPCSLTEHLKNLSFLIINMIIVLRYMSLAKNSVVYKPFIY
jgi:hypothetical protein